MTGPLGADGTTASRVLIVEGQPMVARILEHKLRREGHEVRCERDAAGARRWLEEGGDAALVSVGDGAVCSWPPSGAPAPRAGWLALVESGDEPSARLAMEAGAAGLVVKPFKPTAAAARVRLLLDLVRHR